MKFIFYGYIFGLIALIFIALTYDKTVKKASKYLNKTYRCIYSILYGILSRAEKIIHKDKKSQILSFVAALLIVIAVAIIKIRSLSESYYASLFQVCFWLFLISINYFIMAIPIIVILLIAGPIWYFSRKQNKRNDRKQVD